LVLTLSSSCCDAIRIDVVFILSTTRILTIQSPNLYLCIAGVAMATPTGLVVPNVKNVQALSLLQIASELTRLTGLARGGAVPPADLTGGTFSLSNIGAIGGTYASPVVLPGELAIGALGRLRVVPR
jgi:pyruvate/2-oxoglutarate dehydrogenase complex dihydrolipoamide acyltransferase (E2) component